MDLVFNFGGGIMGTYEKARKATREKIIGVFWEMYKKQPIERITVKELTAACAIGRGTFYTHFHDVYEVLEVIEQALMINLEQVSQSLKVKKELDLSVFSRTLYDFYQDGYDRKYINVLVLSRRDPIFAQGYLSTLKKMLMDICIVEGKKLKTEKEASLVNSSFSSLVSILLNCLCNTSLTLEEINTLIVGLLRNGYYITLTNLFGIDVLKNPFLIE